MTASKRKKSEKYEEKKTLTKTIDMKAENNTIVQSTHFFWNITIGSASRSDISIFLPYSITFGCLRDINQPTWLKKKPRFAL